MAAARISYEPLSKHTASLTFHGDIDSASSLALERAALAATQEGKNQLLVDLSLVRVADATLVESLFHVERLVEHQSGTLVVIAPTGSQIRKALQTAGVERWIRMAATREEALRRPEPPG
jgi:anti-anti-sigma regulatory factor